MRSLVRAALAGALGAGMLGGGIVGVAQAAPPDDAAGQRSYIVRLEPGADTRGLARALSISPRLTGTGGGVTAYVVDTGISTAHPDFGGRAQVVFDNAGGGPARGGDCNGHGTHVAGAIGGTTYGVAKRVELRSVRVLDCNGPASYSGVIAGLEHVLTNHSGGQPEPRRPLLRRAE